MRYSTMITFALVSIAAAAPLGRRAAAAAPAAARDLVGAS